eukprot:3386142-Prymnesium_polylepis.1
MHFVPRPLPRPAVAALKNPTAFAQKVAQGCGGGGRVAGGGVFGLRRRGCHTSGAQWQGRLCAPPIAGRHHIGAHGSAGEVRDTPGGGSLEQETRAGARA